METSKACNDTHIPSKIIEENAVIFADLLFSKFNDSVKKKQFPVLLKIANKTVVFKIGDRNSMDNYRPVSKLPNASKLLVFVLRWTINYA